MNKLMLINTKAWIFGSVKDQSSKLCSSTIQTTATTNYDVAAMACKVVGGGQRIGGGSMRMEDGAYEFGNGVGDSGGSLVYSQQWVTVWFKKVNWVYVN